MLTLHDSSLLTSCNTTEREHEVVRQSSAAVIYQEKCRIIFQCLSE
jgi:hypothetical protein